MKTAFISTTSIAIATFLLTSVAICRPSDFDVLAIGVNSSADSVVASLTTSPPTPSAVDTITSTSTTSMNSTSGEGDSSPTPQDDNPLSGVLGMVGDLLGGLKKRDDKPMILGREYRRRNFKGISRKSTRARRVGEKRASPSGTSAVDRRSKTNDDIAEEYYDWPSYSSDALNLSTQPVVNETSGGYIIEGGSNNGDVIFVGEDSGGNTTRTSEVHTILRFGNARIPIHRNESFKEIGDDRKRPGKLAENRTPSDEKRRDPQARMTSESDNRSSGIQEPRYSWLIERGILLRKWAGSSSGIERYGKEKRGTASEIDPYPPVDMDKTRSCCRNAPERF
ncbi:hypothetical protein SCHPADRAFT_928393 [Schizopora paradoxa]|uniref:Uncharacterized protein n=1 Tax=Schizopora paradoxa TaxID=27342 RepID=A0A0H2RNV4_9AGAM|nr:hypothetical protein SCHPADRAFT_928393 [Schizopora paradoxa]